MGDCAHGKNRQDDKIEISRCAGDWLPTAGSRNRSALCEKTGVDAVEYRSGGYRWKMLGNLQDICAVQGNLDPALMADVTKNAMLAEAKRIVSAFLNDKSFVFNLGHGILPHTPVENVRA